jgi:hypothetical protein
MTINIQSISGDLFQFDTETELIMKNGIVVSRTDYEPVFLNHPDKKTPPELSGIFFVKEGRILSRSGNINPITDPNTILI